MFAASADVAVQVHEARAYLRAKRHTARVPLHPHTPQLSASILVVISMETLQLLLLSIAVILGTAIITSIRKHLTSNLPPGSTFALPVIGDLVTLYNTRPVPFMFARYSRSMGCVHQSPEGCAG